MNKTLNYYNENAAKFAEGTKSVDFRETQDRFLRKLNKGDYILDFGCGSGRDTKYFLEQGYQVDPIDGSEELCRIAHEATSVPVRQMLFRELEEISKYEGIWACSSILHLSKTELEAIFEKMIKALKRGGIIYTSFKYGIYEGERNGRHFTDFTFETFTSFIEKIQDMVMEEYWITGDVRPGRGEEQWLNVILRKK